VPESARAVAWRCRRPSMDEAACEDPRLAGRRSGERTEGPRRAAARAASLAAAPTRRLAAGTAAPASPVPLTFTDENPPAPASSVAPAQRPARAQAKASGQHDPAGRPYRSFRGLLEHLATLTRNQVRFAGTGAAVPVLAEPTSTQRDAFDLIGAPIPLTLR
jgi:hypothetical protein